jgi:hypothetical protein
MKYPTLNYNRLIPVFVDDCVFRQFERWFSANSAETEVLVITDNPVITTQM